MDRERVVLQLGDPHRTFRGCLLPFAEREVCPPGAMPSWLEPSMRHYDRARHRFCLSVRVAPVYFYLIVWDSSAAAAPVPSASQLRSRMLKMFPGVRLS